MNKKLTYKIETIGIIRIKPNLQPLELETALPIHKAKIRFRLHYDKTYYDRFLNEFKGIPRLESSSFIELQETTSKKPFTEELGCKTLFNNQIEKINECIDIIRFSHEQKNPNRKTRLRNIGFDDFIFHKIRVNGEQVANGLVISYGDKTTTPFKIDKFENNVPFEWKTFMRSIDLLDNGFNNESLIIGFNLLDYCIQITLKSLMNNLSSEQQKEELLRQIKDQRLKTYLGPLFTALTGKEFYNKEITKTVIEKLNIKRNKIVHAGKDCNYSETCSALKTIFSIIMLLNKNGNQKFDIPAGIIFYNDMTNK